VGHDGGVDVKEILLPGVGIRFEFTTKAGVAIGVVTRRDGGAEFVVYDSNDPDESRAVLSLDEREVATLAEILGAPRLAEDMADLNKEIPGLASDRIEVTATSPYVGKVLGDTGARTRTGVSIVALVRGGEVIASPTPTQPLDAGDVLVCIGTTDGLSKLGRIIDGS
jgi:TrkA domain protein